MVRYSLIVFRQNITTENKETQLYLFFPWEGKSILVFISASYEVGIIKHLVLTGK